VIAMQSPGQSSPFRRHFVTEPTGQRHPSRRNPGRGFRRGHTTRFFTIVHQQHPAGLKPVGNSVILPRCLSCFRPLSALAAQAPVARRKLCFRREWR